MLQCGIDFFRLMHSKCSTEQQQQPLIKLPIYQLFIPLSMWWIYYFPYLGKWILLLYFGVLISALSWSIHLLFSVYSSYNRWSTTRILIKHSKPDDEYQPSKIVHIQDSRHLCTCTFKCTMKITSYSIYWEIGLTEEGRRRNCYDCYDHNVSELTREEHNTYIQTISINITIH